MSVNFECEFKMFRKIQINGAKTKTIITKVATGQKLSFGGVL